MGRVRATGRLRTGCDDAGSHRTQYHSQHRALQIDPGVRSAALLVGGPAGLAALAGRARSSGRGPTGILKPVASKAGYSDGYRSGRWRPRSSRTRGRAGAAWTVLAPRVRARAGVRRVIRGA